MKLELPEASPRKQRRDVAIWGRVREKGLLRYLFRRGIWENRFSLVGIVVLGFGIFFFIDPEFFRLHIGGISLIVSGMFLMGVLRFTLDAYEEWRRNEKKYREWTTYDSGGDILGLD